MGTRHAVAMAVLLGSAFAWCGTASAVLIDSFVDADDSQKVRTLESPTHTSTNQFATTLSSQRTTAFEYESEAVAADQLTLGVDISTGRMLFNATSGADGFLDTSYNTSAGAGPFNLAGDVGFRLEFQALSGNLPIVFEIRDTDLNTSLYSGILPAGSTTIDVAFAAFSGTASLVSVEQMFFRFNPAAGGDFELDSISTYNVPEPASLSLLGLAAAGLLRRRR